MHGTLRFVLASCVALSHFGVYVYGYNPGVISVVIFYMLAGMVAYKLNSRNYPNQPLAYYKDRIKRIFPLYFIALVFSFIVFLLGAKSYFLSKQDLDVFDYLSNITVIPLAYYMYSGIDKFTLLPPVWSLGVELQFYIIAPFVLLFPKRIITLALLSFVVYFLSSIGYLNTDHFGYRLLCGVLFIFLLGYYIQKSKYNDSNSKYILSGFYIGIVITFSIVLFLKYKALYNYETLFALLVGIPLLYLISSSKSKIDKLLGELSYPIFLLHFPVYWLLNIYDIKNVTVTIILTVFLSYISLLLEKSLFFKQKSSK